MKQTNPQVEQMTSFIVMDVLERANELQKQGIDIIHLEVGEPDFDVPACVAEAAKKAYDEYKASKDEEEANVKKFGKCLYYGTEQGMKDFA